jgi:hypothetical protein
LHRRLDILHHLKNAAQAFLISFIAFGCQFFIDYSIPVGFHRVKVINDYVGGFNNIDSMQLKDSIEMHPSYAVRIAALITARQLSPILFADPFE